jgi:ArsR family transcriptional regulator
MTVTIARKGKARAMAERESLADAFRALADPTRLQILEIIGQGPVDSANQIGEELDRRLSQPTVSHHLGILREAGLVRGEKRGTFMSYELVQDRLNALARWMEGT